MRGYKVEKISNSFSNNTFRDDGKIERLSQAGNARRTPRSVLVGQFGKEEPVE